jgi:hypothetical protein
MGRNNSDGAGAQWVYLLTVDKAGASLMKLGHSLNRTRAFSINQSVKSFISITSNMKLLVPRILSTLGT